MSGDLRRTERETERDANGRWIKGYIPEGAVPFGPHNNANPGGRPRRKPLTEAYQDRMNEKLPAALRKVRVGRVTVTLPEGATYLDWISLGQCIEAGRGNPATAREIGDRLEGKVAQQIELTGNLDVFSRIEQARKKAGNHD
jgi:hypothetical protein